MKTLELKYECSFSRLKCNKVDVADPIKNLTAKNSKNNVFKSKQRTNKVRLNTSRGFEGRKKIRLMLRRPQDSMKGKCFSC